MGVFAALACAAIAGSAHASAMAAAHSPASIASVVGCTVRDDDALPTPALSVIFFDPYVTCIGGSFVAVATNWDNIHVQIARSSELGSWQVDRDDDGSQRDLMPRLPAWTVQDSAKADIWAPELHRIGGRLLVYFSARHQWARTPKNEHRECIGVATAASLNEDFKPEDYPLVCSQFEEGVIDPTVLQENGHVYLYFKSDGNCCNLRTSMYVAELTPGGLALASTPRPLGVINDREWEGTTVEAPTMFKKGQRYFLFYSGSDYWNLSYGVGYAECKGPLGPCTKPENNLVLWSDEARSGPGHQSVLAAAGKYYIAYHTLKPGAEHAFSAPRVFQVSRLCWPNGTSKLC
jgi:GH43 family beta-xylosidase